jgi:hypothetical protein
MLSQGCKADAHNKALLRIVFKSVIVFCFVLIAFVITLFSTALVDVVERAVSTLIVI